MKENRKRKKGEREGREGDREKEREGEEGEGERSNVEYPMVMKKKDEINMSCRL